MNESVVDVILLDVPVALWARWREHLSRMLDELSTESSAAAHVEELRKRLRDEYPTVAETADAELRSAAVRRAETVDVAYPVPRRGRAEVDEFLAALDALDACARKAKRKDLVSPKELVTFRRWYFGEIGRQLDGGFPTPWPASKG
ncbi:MAG TPA: hypothetical protein VF519_06405 [Mycobacteriales bacterium]